MINSIITMDGPILSSDLIESIKIKSSASLNDEAIRKRLSRLTPEIRKLKGIFAQKQVLYYNAEIYGSQEYFEGLKKALKKAGKQYAYLLEALAFHYGIIDINQLPAYVGIPLKLIRRSAATWKCVPLIFDQGVLGGLTRYSGAN